MSVSKKVQKAHQQALASLQEAQAIGEGDPEAAHGIADDVLCNFLEALGYADVVQAFESVKKYYG